MRLTPGLSQIPLPSRPHWYLLFGATEDEIKDICITTLKLYTRKKVRYATAAEFVNRPTSFTQLRLISRSGACRSRPVCVFPLAAKLRLPGERGGEEESGATGGQAEGQGTQPGRNSRALHARGLFSCV